MITDSKPPKFTSYATKHLGMNSMHLEKYILSNISNLTPYIIEERPMNIQALDVFSMFLGEPINDYVANVITAQFLFLESTDARTDIQLYINSPGGMVYAGLGIYDTMHYIAPNVATICTGMAASMSAILLCAGAKGKRTSLTHSRIMIHQPLGGAEGQASDIEITAREIVKTKKELYSILSQHTGQASKKIEKDADRDFWMSATEAKEYGMIDEVLVKTSPKS